MAWSINGKRVYGVQVGEEKWRGANLLKKSSILLYDILDACKICRNIKKVVEYMTEVEDLV